MKGNSIGLIYTGVKKSSQKKLMDKSIMVMAVHHGGYNNKEIL